MGTIQHDAMIVIGSDRSDVNKAHSFAERLFLRDVETSTTHYVLPLTAVMYGYCNGYCSFAVLPDGSKEGWAPSTYADEMRAELKDYIEKLNKRSGTFLHVVEVSFGENGEAINGKTVEAAEMAFENAKRVRDQSDEIKVLKSEKHRAEVEAMVERDAALCNKRALEDVRRDLTDAEAQVNEANKRLDSSMDECDNLRIQVASQRHALTVLRDHFKFSIRMLHKHGTDIGSEARKRALKARKRLLAIAALGISRTAPKTRYDMLLTDLRDAKHKIAEERDAANKQLQAIKDDREPARQDHEETVRHISMLRCLLVRFKERLEKVKSQHRHALNGGLLPARDRQCMEDAVVQADDYIREILLALEASK